MNNAQLAQNFAQGDTSGKTGHMFIDGNIIYSYGYHFPIASLIGARYALFNSDGYSNTTARHKSHVYSALLEADKIIIECPNCDISQAREYLTERVENAQNKAKRARQAWSIERWNNEATRYSEQVGYLDVLTRQG